MDCKSIEYSNHALNRIHQRQIDIDELEVAIGRGNIIKEYHILMINHIQVF